MRRNILVFAALSALLAACGGGAQYSGGGSAAKAPGGSGGPAPAEAPSPAAYGEPGSEEAPSADGAGSTASGAPAAAPRALEQERRTDADDSRPGLGTQWGENRESRVSTAPFFREDPDRPFGVAKLFYNDRAGVRAMARRSGISDFSDGSSRTGSGAVTVRLLDSSGRPLEGFSTGSSTYVVGEHGERYIIQIRNHTGNRFEAVATVDGLDVINGRTGSFANRGYIVQPFSTVEIDGFRRSFDTVAAFRFGSVRGSYAAKKGSDRNVGVIGVAFFHERGSTWPWSQDEVDRRHNADPFPGRFAAPPSGF